VVRFARGTEAGIRLEGEGGAMGVTAVLEGRVLPFVTADIERVQGALRRSHSRTCVDARLGRALGRVLAQELYDVLSGSLKHDREGVAKASLSGDELSMWSLRLGAMSRTRLVKALLAGQMDRSRRWRGRERT